MALVLVLFTVLLTSHTFYWIQSELLQGCVLVIFLFGCIDRVQTFRAWHLLLFYPLIGLILFIHPLTFIPFCFLWIFFLIQKQFTQNWYYYSLFGFLILIMVTKHFFLHGAAYDATSMGLAKNAYKFWKFFQFKSTRNFWRYCLTDYYFFPILLMWISYFYYKTKQKWKLILVLGFTFAYLQLVNATFAWGPYQFHLESFYQILAIFLLLPLIFDVLPHWNFKLKNGPMLLVMVIICTRLLHLYIQHRPYTQRLDWMKAALQSTWVYSETKFIIHEKKVPIDTVMNGWAGAYETLLLSAQLHPDSTRTIFIHNDEVQVEQYSDNTKAFLTPFGAIDYASMPSRYFNFKDESMYKELESINRKGSVKRH